jgi:ectoine hydroxylase
MFKKEEAEKTAYWLKSQDLEALATTWTDREPLVPLAVYQNVHQNDSPINKLASEPEMLRIASQLIGDEVYIWSSKVNLKAAWCGTVEYPHQDYVYWSDRGYEKMNMMSCMIFLEPHGVKNGGLCVFPGSHKEGFIKHTPFININGLSKFTISPDTLNQLEDQYGSETIEANPGDVLFFHTGLVHGSSHNLSSQSRMIILSQLNTHKNKPTDVIYNAKQFNLKRAKIEMEEAERRYIWYKKKYESQLNSQDIEFNSPIPEEERSL